LEDKNKLFFVFELYIARRIHLEHKLTRVHEEKCKARQDETPHLVRVSTEERDRERNRSECRREILL
jgi:hypothetical protein